MKKLILLLTLFSAQAFSQSVVLRCQNFALVESATVNSTASELLVAANKFRRCLTIVNKSDVTVYITFESGGGATEGVPIPAGGNWDQNIVNTNAIYARAASGSSKSVLVMSGD